MNFENPWALLILIAIPVLIIIYIIKNKYRDETAPSTYIWEISQQFLKKRNPIRKIEHLLALIVECLTIAGLSFTLAHPEFTLKGKAENIVFIIDSSASMQMNSSDASKTKFAKAVQEITDVVNDSAAGCTYTLITAGNTSDVVCESIDDKSRFLMYLDTVKVTNASSDIESSVAYAQNMFSNGKGSLCYLLTDKKLDLDETANIEYINLATEEENYALLSLNYAYDNSKKGLVVSGSAISYANPVKNLHLDFKLNDVSYGSMSLSLNTANTATEFSTTITDVKEGVTLRNVSKVQVTIREKDALAIDNTMIAYPTESAKRTKVLLISDTPLYLKTALQAIGGFTTTIRGTSGYNSKISGYDIYMFDSFTPENLPSDGAVWLFNCAADIENCGYVYQRSVNAEDDGGIVAKYTGYTDDKLYNELTKSTVSASEVPIKSYQRYTLIEDFTTIMSYDNIPMIFAGRNAANQKEIVFSFALSNSDLPLKSDFISLITNLCNYSAPTLLSTYEYTAYDTMTLSIADNIDRITITTPSGDEDYFTTASGEYASYTVEEVGTYSIQVDYTDVTSSTKTDFYVKFNNDEGNPTVVDSTKYSLVINSQYVKGDGIFDSILPWVIVAAVLFSLDWVLYTHEQY